MHLNTRSHYLRLHSTIEGWLARSTLDGHHEIVCRWVRHRPLTSPADFDTEPMFGQRDAWLWRCPCCGKEGITVLVPAGTEAQALAKLHAHIEQLTSEVI